MIKVIKQKLSKHPLWKSILTLLSGSAIAQLLPIAITPILTRIYEPTDFGVLAIFMSFTLIFGPIANARYEMAIVLPDDDKDAINITALGIIISFIMSIVILIGIIVFHEFLIVKINNPLISEWIYLTPLVIFMIGVFNVLNYFNTRQKKYKIIAQSKVIKSGFLAILQLLIGLIKSGPLGLIVGYASSHLFGNTKLIRDIVKDKTLMDSINKERIKLMAIRYRDFFRFTFPASLANRLSFELINFFISSIYSTIIVGFYSMANRILMFPISLIGDSFGQIYIKEASDERKKYGTADKTFKSITSKLAIIGLPIFLVIYLFAEEIFGFVLGDKWEIAGTYARIMVPLLYIRFIASPVATTLSVFEKNRWSLMWQLGLLSINLIVFAVSYLFKFEFIVFLNVFVLSIAAYYGFFLVLLYRLVRGIKE